MKQELTKSDITQLVTSDLFKGIPQEELASVLPILQGQIVEIPSRGIFFDEGDKIEVIGVVLFGEIKMIRKDASGKERVVSKLHHGDIFGPQIACTPTQISPYVISATVTSKIYTFRIIRMDKLPSETCNVMNKALTALLASDNIRKQNKIEILSSPSIRDRILMYLTIQCRKRGNSEFDVPFDRQEMADYLSINRTVLSHEISRLRSEGIIECRKNHFKILNIEKLSSQL